MSSSMVSVAYIGAIILFILSLGGLSNPESSRRGNLYGMVGMLLAVLATVFGPRVTLDGLPWIIAALLVGGSVGLLEKYPTMALAVANGRQLLTKWRLSKLEQQFILAADKSREVLELDLRDQSVNSRLTGVVSQHARFILSMFMGQKVDVEIKLAETPQMKARNDALDYLAQQMASIGGKPENVIEGSYTVVAPQGKREGNHF